MLAPRGSTRLTLRRLVSSCRIADGERRSGLDVGTLVQSGCPQGSSQTPTGGRPVEIPTDRISGAGTSTVTSSVGSHVWRQRLGWTTLVPRGGRIQDHPTCPPPTCTDTDQAGRDTTRTGSVRVDQLSHQPAWPILDDNRCLVHLPMRHRDPRLRHRLPQPPSHRLDVGDRALRTNTRFGAGRISSVVIALVCSKVGLLQ